MIYLLYNKEEIVFYLIFKESFLNMNLEKLGLDHLKIIMEFLIKDDRESLFSTSKELEKKKEKFPNRKETRELYNNINRKEIFESKNFKSLNFSGFNINSDKNFDFNSFSNLEILNLLNSGINNSHILILSQKGLKKLDISFNKSITIVDDLCNISILNLVGCTGITNVDKLFYVKKLNISGCINISDVNKLKRVEELNISGCSKIECVKGLNYLKKLNISLCPNITEICDLKSLISLDMSHNLKKIKGLNELTGLLSLNLYRCLFIQNKDINLLVNLHKLILKGCTEISTLNSFKKIRDLNIQGTNVSDLSSLIDLEILNIKDTKFKFNLENSKKLNELIVDEYDHLYYEKIYKNIKIIKY
jgi:hypothetical protein